MFKSAILLPLAAATMLAVLAAACVGGPPLTAPPLALTEPPPAADSPSSDSAPEPTAAMPEPTAAMSQPEASAMAHMTNPHSLDAFPPEAAYGDYAVGTATTFAVDNRQRFDPWNTAYASPGYRELLRKVEAAGQTRTVIFQLWYPATPDTAAGRLDGQRSPYPSADGERADRLDFFLRDDALYSAAGGGGFFNLQTLYADDGLPLSEATPERQNAVVGEITRRSMTQPLNSWRDATPADGKFPVIVVAHGLGGHHSMWRNYAEFLASHGYIVAAPTFISDGTLPMVFHDPASPFVQGATPQELQDAYRTLLTESKVIPQFYMSMFGFDASAGFDAVGSFDPTTAQVVPGGVERATTMMRNLFRQRVADVGLVLQTVRLLGEDAADCRAALTAMGATTAADGLCGRLAGRVDGASAGLSGHSLGSMTAQLGANHLPGVQAALGINNAPPFTWTPEEMYGAGETAEGLPVGSHKPVLNMIGDEDDFVQFVFVSLFQATLAAAGGDPTLAFPLEPERALPERMENPQPVALSAYRRGTGDRILAIVRDADHGTIVDDFARDYSWLAYHDGEIPFAQTPIRNRKPTGEAAFAPPGAPGEAYYQMDWATVPDAGEVYLPHLIRDWYARAWFDWYLKGDEAAHQRLQTEDPFGNLTHVRRDMQ